MVITIKLSSAVSDNVPLRYMENALTILKIQFSLIMLVYPRFLLQYQNIRKYENNFKTFFFDLNFHVNSNKLSFIQFRACSSELWLKLRNYGNQILTRKNRKFCSCLKKQNVKIKVSFQEVGTQSLHKFCCNMCVHTFPSICFKKNHCTLLH